MSEHQGSGEKRVPNIFRKIGIDNFLLAVSLILGFIIWHFIAAAYSSVILAPPVEVAASLLELLEDGSLLTAAWGSLHQYFLGFFLAIIVGVPVGFMMGQSQTIKWAVNPYIDAVYSTPVVAYLPLIIAWFGLQFKARVFFVFVFCIFEILIDTYQGVEEIQDQYKDVAKSFSASRLDTQTKIIFPASLPHILAGIRLSAGRGIRGMITAEIFLALTNLGRILEEAAAQLQTSTTLAVIVVIVIIGLTAQYTVEYVERKVIPWHYQMEETQ